MRMEVTRNPVAAGPSHLRATFSKTGVTRQAKLVRMLLGSVISLG